MDLRIPASRTEELRALLLKSAEETLFHLAVLEERGVGSGPGESPFCFVGWPEKGPLSAVAFVGGNWFVSVHAAKAEHAAELARAVRSSLKVRRAVGERAATDAFWEAWSPGRASTILSHPQQLMIVRPGEAGTLTLSGLRPAHAAEEGMVYEASALMQLEELGIDPRLEEPGSFRSQVQERLRTGRTWVFVENGDLVFKAEVALKSRHGAQIGGVWVPPHHRGKGWASRGMTELARRLLDQVPAVSLHVHEKNEPAVAAYRRAGFKAVLPFRLLRGAPIGHGNGA